MTNNTTPSRADALIQLIENYVEKRHTHGAPQYNVVTARARDAVLAALAALIAACDPDTIRELLAERDDLLENGKQAIRWAPSSAHWSNELKRLFGEDAREGINVLESRLRDTQTERDALRELLREALESLTCGDTGDDLEDSHRCGRCDEYVDRNAKLRTKIRTALASTPASLQSAQQPTKSDEHKEILRECRNQAMRWTVKARIPEAGIFGRIAQDLDYLCEQLGVKND